MSKKGVQIISFITSIIVLTSCLEIMQVLSSTTSSGSSMAKTYPLRVSPTKRYLVDAKGNPFFVFADTGWMIFASTTKSEAEYYLECRRKQGVNSILCYAAPFFIDAKNKDGNLAFVNNDLSKPNDKYFDYVDWVIKLAAKKGMQVIMCPVEMCNYAKYYTISNSRALGRYMGKRYKDFDNILWFTGGDIQPTEEQIAISNSLAAGIRDHDTTHLISFHPGGGNSSSEFFNDQPWLDYNMIQVHSPDSAKAYQLPLTDYNKTPVRPTILIETCYEDMIKGNPAVSNTPYQIRKSIAWGVLSGGFGLCYGNQIMYKFTADILPNWKTRLNQPAFLQTEHIANCIKKLAWQKLVPDQKRTLLTSGYGTNGTLDYAAAALANDGSFAVIYLPTSRSITINMRRFNGSKYIKWFDPTNNTYTTEGAVTNYCSRSFAARPANSAGQYDWIMIIGD